MSTEGTLVGEGLDVDEMLADWRTAGAEAM